MLELSVWRQFGPQWSSPGSAATVWPASSSSSAGAQSAYSHPCSSVSGSRRGWRSWIVLYDYITFVHIDKLQLKLELSFKNWSLSFTNKFYLQRWWVSPLGVEDWSVDISVIIKIFLSANTTADQKALFNTGQLRKYGHRQRTNKIHDTRLIIAVADTFQSQVAGKILRNWKMERFSELNNL